MKADLTCGDVTVTVHCDPSASDQRERVMARTVKVLSELRRGFPEAADGFSEVEKHLKELAVLL